MKSEKLVYMANQIATFFKSQPAETAVPGISGHINDFWEPRMRSALFAHIEKGGDGLDPLVLAAAPHIRKVKEPA
ncbi:formate dehydrogenase subunit delta [Thalassospira marina]|uniref:Formate dehydrogenase n=1 Tax=Thalassospira marina TaxID=2048283 RepID=A0A2N3KCV0_9PROT|nr:formate dehydrogenase subunit delta [Thalassospira marina]AUG51455.1 formate dehydrogenase [Thalassospira marina]PKR48407.1 formate dehydrogenase [Thalassospira marina]